jgi:hypothetical protein
MYDFISKSRKMNRQNMEILMLQILILMGQGHPDLIRKQSSSTSLLFSSSWSNASTGTKPLSLHTTPSLLGIKLDEIIALT